MNTHISNRLKALKNIMLALYDGGKGLPSAVIGAERELFIKEFLSKMFPAHFRFSSGTITDSKNNICRLSGQIDIVIELPFQPSFPLIVESQRLIIAESVAAVIEVKSNIVSGWDNVQSKVLKVKKINRTLEFGITHEFDTQKYFKISFNDLKEHIPFFIVSYKGYKTIKNLEKKLNSIDLNCRPDGILIIESGVFIYKDFKQDGEKGIYAFIAVITGILNSILSAGPGLEKYLK